MAKRGAETDINHENWDNPYEAEEAGTFKPASEENLQRRTIRVAKRRITSSNSEDTGKKAFAAFGGFKPAAPASVGSKPGMFSFLGSTVNTSTTPTNGTATETAVSGNTQVTPQQRYLSSLQQLNRDVSHWIKTHVDANPTCILTPVFSDYEKHLSKLQEEKDSSEKTKPSQVLSPPANLATFKFSSGNANVNAGGANNFQINIPADASSNKSLFSLPPPPATGKSPLLQHTGKDEDDSNKPKVPSIFGSITSGSSSALLSKPDPASLMVNPFLATTKKDSNSSNGATAISSSTAGEKEKDDNEDAESDEPPKVEFTPIQEDGAVFTTRCKVFVKKDDNFKDRGVGTLFIKKVVEGKHQLLVRAETVLGNILLNLLLTSSVPTRRMGSNNVMLVCLPTPQDPPPPTTVLLRVKTAADADSLLVTLDKYKS